MALRTMRDIPLLSGADAFSGHINEFQADRLAFFQRVAKEGGGLCRLRFFNKPALAVNDPQIMHELFVEKSRSFGRSLSVRTLLYPLAGEGLFSSDGDLWKRQRKLMSPLFSAPHMESYTDGMRESVDHGVDMWRDGEVIDVGREMTRITMSVVGKALFGIETFDEADSLGGAITEVLTHITESSGRFSTLMRFQIIEALEGLEGRLPASVEGARRSMLEALRFPARLPTPKSRRIWAAIKTLDELIQRMIDERRAIGLDRPDLLTKLLRARDDDGATMTDKQIRDEMLTLFFAGHETTTVGTTWAFYLLAQNPGIYRRHRDEVDALGGDAITFKDLPRLPFTLRIFKEALRLYPPAFFIDRQALVDAELSGHMIPRGTLFFVCPYATQRLPELYPDPEVFDPDRFLPEAEAARHRLAWIPFGAGPRICLGIHFALAEAQLILARITQRYTLSAVSKQPAVPVPAGTLRSKSPIFMQARARKDLPYREAATA